ncbi:MAG: DNA/RNA non-specific endonuclease [Bacteroidia bacterium]|nr:DNA/RNA non-specific endonuclease [Bacteroidia bacterium]
MKKLTYLLAVALWVGVVSCSESDDTQIDDTPDVPEVPETPGDDPEEPEIESVCHWAKRLEVPALKKGNILHPVVTYEEAVADSVMTFIYEWDPAKLHIRWTAFYFDAYTSQHNVKRKDWNGAEFNGVTYSDDPWHVDEYLAESMRTNYEANHRNNGFDRGHMVASADRVYSMAANFETFAYSNISPQYADFNQKYWVQLESKVQDWGANRTFCDTLYVCKGATIDNDEDILKIVKQLPVPKYYYMALMKVKDGKYSAVGFLMEHDYDGYTSGMSLKPYAMSIDQLEEKTGVDFFHNLEDDIENDIEKNYQESAWF